MKVFILFVAALLSNMAFAVEYVKACSTLGEQDQVYLGPGWFVMPGSDTTHGLGTCLLTTTGLTEYLSTDGSIITTQSQLEARVTQLEKRIALLLAKKAARQGIL